MPGICELTPDGLNFLGKSGRQGLSELCAQHRDVDYRGDCSQVKGGAGTACSQKPGEPHLRPMISWALIAQRAHFSSSVVSPDSTCLSCHEVSVSEIEMNEVETT